MIVKIFLICMLAILPSNLCSGANDDLFKLVKASVDEMANKIEPINNVIQLIKKGYLGRGGFGFTYKGKLKENPTEYAIKITYPMYVSNARKEFEMYTYLHAINKSETEAFGIPVIHYFGMWNKEIGNFTVMAMTLCDSEFDKSMKSKNFEQLDIMIMFREFVKISKYIHSCGVRHNDIKFSNMMFRANKAFIIDFNLAVKMEKRAHSGTLLYLPRRSHGPASGSRYPIDDYESFLYSMCELVDIELDWFNRDALKNVDNTKRDEFIYNHKMNISKTMQTIEKIKFNGLKTVFVRFAKHVFDERATIPPYDDIYNMINSEIKSSIPAKKPVIASWVRDRKRKQAIDEYFANPYFNISTIPLPTNKMPKYPDLDFDFFTRK